MFISYVEFLIFFVIQKPNQSQRRRTIQKYGGGGQTVIYRKRASRGLYIVYPIFTAAYIVERLVLKTIYVLNKEILQFLSLKSMV